MKETVRFVSLCLMSAVLAALWGCATVQQTEPKAGARLEEPQAQVQAPVPKPAEQVQTQAVQPKKKAAASADAAAAKKQKTLAAIRSMSKLGDMAIQHLTEMSTMRDRDVRLAAIDALGGIDSPCALDPIITALSDDDRMVREKAVTFLIYRGPELTRVHVDRLTNIMHNAHKCWPDPAMDGATIYASHFAGKVLSKAESPFISPELAREGYEAMVHY
ncbi:hypothetical protein Dalk_4706 [Desulfatibacillum aliphaticivorans]|uniref:PBS lyase HEAT domain protein repeat-containing protein n=1 Tax=Desulfatibacillum aliphaticivorans TaxID=218208 RepID=B8FCV3_DESAL|nr:HEAT repeat domain-containing protein [Desulfatibacillum aliphaticivorans]ACL06384.1 hypothetical protein Dalk_4706 [Desulfatibacillum aliphaticivorans]